MNNASPGIYNLKKARFFDNNKINNSAVIN